MRMFFHVFLFVFLISGTALAENSNSLNVGTKKFTESYVLGRIAKRSLENAGFKVRFHPGMGGTIILWEALKGGNIDLYPDYTGTIQEEILKSNKTLSLKEMRESLAQIGIGISNEIGFNNTYALVMKRDQAEKLGIRKISDLANHPELRYGLTHEFLDRRDGWEPLKKAYHFQPRNVRGIDHAIGYAALASGQTDVKDAYSTDAKIAEYDLTVLEDDLGFFPQYQAVFLYRLNLNPEAIDVLNNLGGTIDEHLMIRMNAEAESTKNYVLAASLYFGDEARKTAHTRVLPFHVKLMRWTGQHLMLVSVSLFFAVLAGIPLGIWASRGGWMGNFILGTTGMIYTIPSLALLALLVPVPFLGISVYTAITALFLYSLLPIVRNTATGLQNIPKPVRESASVLGLSPAAQLFKVYLPMASRTILAGIKTSAVINVGTATLAALIGAGGLGEPIISGLNLNDHATILQGAIPAALLALLVLWCFDLLDRLIIPKGLQIQAKLQ